LFASLLEVPPFILLLTSASKNDGSAVFTAVTWYHIVPLSILSFGWLGLFGHGAPSIGGLRLWQGGFALATFLIQVALISPLVFAISRAFERAAKK
jgi:hypothetical protein